MLTPLLRTVHRQWLAAAFLAWLATVILSLPLLSLGTDRYVAMLVDDWSAATVRAVEATVRPALLSGRHAELERELLPLTALPLVAAIQVYAVDDTLIASVRDGDAVRVDVDAATAAVVPISSQGTLLGNVRIEESVERLRAQTFAAFRRTWIGLQLLTGVVLLAGAMLIGARQRQRLAALRRRVLLLAEKPEPETPPALAETDPVAELESWLPEAQDARTDTAEAAPAAPALLLDVLLHDRDALDAAARAEMIGLLASRARVVSGLYGGDPAVPSDAGIRVRLPATAANAEEQALCAAWVLRALATGRERFDSSAPVALSLRSTQAQDDGAATAADSGGAGGKAAPPALPGPPQPGAIAVPASWLAAIEAPERFEFVADDHGAVYLRDVQGDLRTQLTRQFQQLNRGG